MKKLLMLLGTTTVLFLACNVNWNDLAIPEQVKVDTQPGLYLSLTRNLFTGEYAEYSPEKLITDNLSPAKVKEMIGESMTGITVATYKDPAGKPIPQTYLLRYPIMEMQLDLSQYMEQLNVDLPLIEYKADSVPGGTLPEAIPAIPAIPIVSNKEVDLRDMAKLVTTMSYTSFGIKIKGDYEGILQVDISNGAGGFSVEGSTGTPGADGYTDFVSSYETPKEWTPDKHDKLTLNIKLLKAPVGGNISVAPEFVLGWTTATVKPSGSGLADSVPLDLSSLGDTLGGIQFETVTAYLYASGLSGSKATVSLKSGGSSLVADKTPLTDADAPKFDDGGEYKGDLLPSSTSTGSSIDLTDTLNDSLDPDKTVELTYEVSFSEITLTNALTDPNIGKTISAVLLIKLPLEFKYTGEEFDAKEYKDLNGAPITDSYVEFKMKDFDIATIFEGDEDLLKPIKDELSGNDVTLNFKSLSLILTGCDTTLLPDVSIAIKLHKEAATGRLIDFDFSSSPGKDIRFDFEMEDDEPFAPVIHILLKKGDDGSAVLALGNGGQFRFGLGVEVESKLDATIEL